MPYQVGQAKRFAVKVRYREYSGAFRVAWIATHYDVGDVVRGSGGCRKVRWSRKGTGKSGGVRVIYYNMLEDGTIWLLLIYAKNEHENIPAHILKAVKEEIICP